MMHRNRIWGEPVEVTLEEFAEKVADGRTWTVCTAWKVGEYVFVNDATGDDGAQEYAVLVRDPESPDGWLQIESWTCSWMSRDEIPSYYAKLAHAPLAAFGKVTPRFVKHGYGTDVGPLSCCA